MTRRKSQAPAHANERSFPHIVELAVPPDGLNVRLSREMAAFHQARGVQQRFGWPRTRNGHNYCRWCFSDPEIAEAFCEQFEGARFTRTLASSTSSDAQHSSTR
jgi:hypothetical protein